jgi:predicted PurR-regulated permease PerM
MPASAADPVSRNALVILATVAGGAALYALSSILTPLALAMFLAVMIDSFARVLQARLPGVSQKAATPLAVVLSVLMFGGAAFFIADNATVFAGELVAYAPRLDGVIARLASLVGIAVPPTVDQLLHQLDPASLIGKLARALEGVATTAIFVLVYLGFILASRRGWERKAAHLFAGRAQRAEATATFLRIRNGVERYLWLQTLTGLMLAAVSWGVMTAVGLDNAVFWAIVIFIVAYVPVLGGIVGVGAPPLFALVQFDTLWQAITLLVVLELTHAFVGNVILPRMQGRSLNIDPIALLLGLTFWTAIWGLAGAFLSTPLTVVCLVILAQFPGSRWIAVLISGDGDPSELKQASPDADPSQTEAATASASGRART